MRKILIALIPTLLLTACVDDSASYYADGAASGNHTLTVRRAQRVFWRDTASVDLVLARLPECQRRIELAEMPAADVELELFSAGDNIWTLRAGKDVWQVETQSCTLLPEAKGDPGELVGVFRIDGDRLVFAAAVNTPVPDGAPAPVTGAAPVQGAGPAAAPAAAPATAPAQ